MPFWKRATEKVTEHAVCTAKKNVSETLIGLVPVALLLLGLGASMLSGHGKTQTSPVSIVINIVTNKEDI